MRSNVDYVWVPVVIIVLILIFAWKPITGFFGKLSDSATNQEGYERGKEVFYSTTRWTGPQGYKSCAMCHAPDFVVEPGKKVEMEIYREGKPYILKEIGRRYPSGMLDTGDRLYDQCMVCLCQGDRMGMGRVTRNIGYIEDLLEYVRRQ